MKTSIHPPYFPHAKVRCICGSEFTVGSTKESLDIEICSQCHPFYTGQKKVIDAAGRVERYRRLVAHASNKATGRGKNPSEPAAPKMRTKGRVSRTAEE
jgi:large subunit ribosomal protein L31